MDNARMNPLDTNSFPKISEESTVKNNFEDFSNYNEPRHKPPPQVIHNQNNAPKHYLNLLCYLQNL